MKKSAHWKVVLSIFLVFCLMFLQIPPVHAASVSISLNNNTAACNAIVGFGGETDPFMYFYRQQMLGMDDDDFSIFSTRIKKAGISFVRMWFHQDWWEPVNDNSDPNVMNGSGFAWNSTEMQSIYKYLDVLKANNVSVQIQIFGGDSKKLYPWMYWSETVGVPAPDKKTEYAENIAALVKHLTVTKGYTNCKYVSICNEPETSFYPPAGYDHMTYYESCVQTVHDRITAEGLPIGMIGSEGIATTSHGESWYTSSTINLKNCYSAYNMHYSPNMSDLTSGTYASKIAGFVNAKNTNDPNGSQKPFVLSENCGNDLRGTAADGLLIAGLVAQGLSNGLAGISQWRLYDDIYPAPVNANQTMTGEDDYGWGLWNSKQDDWTPKYKYYIYPFIAKYMLPGSTAYTTTSNNSNVCAAIVKSPEGKHTILTVNLGNEEAQINFTLQKSINTTFKRYSYTGATLDAIGNLPASDLSISVNGTSFSNTIPARSAVVYTDITDSSIPAQVSGLSASAPGNKKVTLNWTKNTEADLAYYRIYRDTVSGFTPSSRNLIGEKWVAPSESAIYNDNNVEPGTTYYYKVAAVDKYENMGPASSQVQVASGQISYSNQLTVDNDTVNKYFDIISDSDNGYAFRVSKVTGTGVRFKDGAGVVRSNISGASYSYPRVLKATATAYNELVQNGSLESYNGNSPTNWSFWATDAAAQYVLDTSTYHSGARSLKMINTDNSMSACWYQSLQGAAAGKNYDLSYWIKTDNVARSGNGTGAMATMIFYDSNGNVLGEAGSGKMGTTGWLYKHVNATAPAGTASAMVYLKLWGTSGTVWFDDVKISESAERAVDGIEGKPATSVTYNNIDAGHKQIVTVNENGTLYYDFYADRIDIKFVGNNPGGYFMEEGGFQPKTNAKLVWSDGTTDNISNLTEGDSVQRAGTSVHFRQDVSPNIIKYDFKGASKNITFINSGRNRGYYLRFAVNSGETYSMYFTRDNSIFNDSIESGSGAPLNWASWTTGSGAFTWDGSNYHSGSKALKISNSNVDSSVWYQQISSADNTKEVEATAWIKTENVSGVHGALLSICAKDSSGNILGELWSPSISGTKGWQQVKVRMSIPRNTATIDIGGKLWGSSGTAWFDDFTYTTSDNSVMNPGSEMGSNSPEGWSNWSTSGTPFTWDSSVNRSGSRSLKISQTTGQGSGWMQFFNNLQMLKEYEFGGWIKTSGVTGGHGAFISIIVKDINGAIVQEAWTPVVTATNDWTYVSGKMVLPPDRVTVSIECRLWGSTGTAWFDDVSLKMVKK